jgi:hypothetical protein
LGISSRQGCSQGVNFLASTPKLPTAKFLVWKRDVGFWQQMIFRRAGHGSGALCCKLKNFVAINYYSGTMHPDSFA